MACAFCLVRPISAGEPLRVLACGHAACEPCLEANVEFGRVYATYQQVCLGRDAPSHEDETSTGVVCVECTMLTYLDGAHELPLAPASAVASKPPAAAAAASGYACCPEHEPRFGSAMSALVLFCPCCNELACPLCGSVGRHAGHGCLELSEANARAQQAAAEHVARLAQADENLAASLAAVDGALSALASTDRAREVQAAWATIEHELQRVVHERIALLSALTLVRDRDAQQPLAAQRALLVSCREAVRRAQRSAQTLLSAGPDESVLVCRQAGLATLVRAVCALGGAAEPVSPHYAADVWTVSVHDHAALVDEINSLGAAELAEATDAQYEEAVARAAAETEATAEAEAHAAPASAASASAALPESAVPSALAERDARLATRPRADAVGDRAEGGAAGEASVEEGLRVRGRSTSLNAAAVHAAATAAAAASRLPFGYFSGRQLTQLPDDLGVNVHWEKLVAARNFITVLPPAIGALALCRELDLSLNAISAVPAELGALTALEKLLLAGNAVRDWPSELSSLARLTCLDVSFNGLAAVPDCFRSLSALRSLNLRHNALADVPAGLWSALPNLTALDAAENALTSLAPSQADWLQLCQLETLDLESNALASLPDCGHMTALRTVHLAHNRLVSLPASLVALPRLTELDASHNALTAILPDDALAEADSALASVLLRNNRLEHIPALLLSCTGLRALHLAANALATVPLGISALIHLDSLNLACNRLTTLPPELGLLGSLTELNLAGNQLDSFDSTLVEGMPLLTTLNLGDNKLVQAPNVSVLGEQLNELVLCGNAITSVPAWLEMLVLLETLMLDRNAIATVESESALVHVPRLDLAHNSLASLSNDELRERLHAGLDGNAPALRTGASAARGEDTSADDVSARGEPFVSGAAQARFRVGFSEMIGKRPSMEDALSWHWAQAVVPGGNVDYFALFDGHGGAKAAQLCAARLHCHVFASDGPVAAAAAAHAPGSSAWVQTRIAAGIEQTEAELFVTMREASTDERHCGTTAVLAVFVGSELHVANVGDARAVLVRASDGAAVRLSCDHKPSLDEESRRLRLAGAHVTANGRVNGNLAVSRAIGDAHFKPWVCSMPHFAPPTVLLPGDVLILACDGVWDELSDQAAADCVRAALLLAPANLSRAAAALRDRAYCLGSDDNISCILVQV